jgi:drug/metabolite transporter (DMT)-like permease
MDRNDGVLAKGSLVFAVLAALAGIVLIVATSSLADDLRRLGKELRTQTIVGLVVVLSLAAFCFFEAYRFYRFFQSPGIRHRYYAKSRLRRLKQNKG